jgi:Uma2 family endonuclease
VTRTVVLGEPPQPPATFEPTAGIIVEIVSPGDETYAKLGFYFAHGVREVLIVDPDRATVEWYGRGADGLTRTGRKQLRDLTESALSDQLDRPTGCPDRPWPGAPG